MILYHRSRLEPWPAIAASGRLEPRWPREGDWPRTVHFTDEVDKLPWGWDATTHPLVVKVDVEAEAWTPWGRTHVPHNSWSSLGIHPEVPSPWGHDVTTRNEHSGHWYVTTNMVPSTQWLEVYRLDTGEVLWPATAP
ncbi:hypothetical protein ACFXHD_03040 [Streptomyces hydrogenans]|uniref:hypothetical protein n=1 Tax=Streptomyces hydrogenans TaxID=1873719 RepID=UPI00368F2A86